MNKLIFVLLIISIITSLTGIRNSGYTNQTTLIKEYELQEPQRKAWYGVKDNWMKNEYHSCMKKFKLKMSCAGCVYIYMKAEISIDDNSKLSSYRIIDANICSKKKFPALEKCFIEPLKQKTLPEDLKNMIFETMLGTGLKC